MNGIKNRSRIEVKWFIHRLEKDVRGERDPPIESQGSEWPCLLSKPLLREKPICSWIQTASDHNGLCLKNMSSSISKLVHS